MQLATARHTVLWMARPPEHAAAGEALAAWLRQWEHVGRCLYSCGQALDRCSATKVLVQASAVAAWLLRLHQRGLSAPSSGWKRLGEYPLYATRLLCVVARRLTKCEGCRSKELVLAVEAGGIAAAGLLARLEGAGDRGSPLSSSFMQSISDLVHLYEALMEPLSIGVALAAALAEAQQQAVADLSSVPCAAESMVGAAEASRRLAAALVQLTQPEGGMALVRTPARPCWSCAGDALERA